MTANINILIVDDEPRNLTVLETILDDPSYRLVRAQSADEALLALMVDDYALLILDVRMPGMNGFELAQIIKQRKKTADIPIIFLTAHYNEDQHVVLGYEAGAVDYLHKPVNRSVLASKVSVFAELFRNRRVLSEMNRRLMQEVVERRSAQEQLTELNAALDQRVSERTEALRCSEERLRLATEAAQMGLWDWDLRADAIVWSPRQEQLYGYPPGAPKRPLADFEARLHPEDAGGVHGAIQQAVEQHSDYGQEYRVVWPDGGVHWLHAAGRVLRNSSGEPARMIGMTVDITERKRSEAHMALLLGEVNHRSKNLLGVIEAIARQTLSGCPSHLRDNYLKRLQALSASQNVLVESKWRGVGLQQLVRAQIALFAGTDGRIRWSGPALRLAPFAAQAIGMALHELATNATKYGALSNPGGGVEIEWKIDGGQSVVLDWVEHGGPPVTAPRSRGFGSIIVNSAIEEELEASVVIDFAPAGLRWRAAFPAALTVEDIAADST